VAGPDGPIEIRRGKQWALLAALLLQANSVVAADALVERLWANPPASARKLVQATCRSFGVRWMRPVAGS